MYPNKAGVNYSDTQDQRIRCKFPSLSVWFFSRSMLGTLILTGRSVSRLSRQLRLSIFTVTFNQLVRQVYPEKEYPSSGTGSWEHIICERKACVSLSLASLHAKASTRVWLADRPAGQYTSSTCKADSFFITSKQEAAPPVIIPSATELNKAGGR